MKHLPDVYLGPLFFGDPNCEPIHDPDYDPNRAQR